MSDSNKTTEFRLKSLTAAGLLMLWYQFDINLSKHPWFEWATFGNISVLPHILVVIMVFYLVETLVEYNIYYNKSLMSALQIMLALFVVMFAAFMSYPKLVHGTLAHETSRLDIAIPVGLSLITSLSAVNLRHNIEQFIVFYRFRKTILPGFLFEITISSLFSFSGIVILYYTSIDTSYVVLATRYTAFLTCFILVYVLLIPRRALFSDEKLESLSRKNESLNRQVELSDAKLSQKLKANKDKRRLHRIVMKEIERDSEEERKKIMPKFKFLENVEFIQEGKYLEIEKMDDEVKIIQVDFFDKEKKVVVDSIDIKFKYVQEAIRDFKIPSNKNDIRGFLTPLSLKALELQLFNEEDKNKLLFKLSHDNQLVGLKKLIEERNPNINYVGEDGWTPLLIAVANGHTEVVKYLLQKAADPNISNKLGLSSLCFAAWYGNEKMCRILLNYGADINHQSVDGMTPLMKATSRGHGPVVKFLLEKKADANLVDENHNSALTLAEKGGYGDIALLLRKP